MNADYLDELDADDLRTLARCAVDDLLRLAAMVLHHGSPDTAQADAATLLSTWEWPDAPNAFSDGSAITAVSATTHIFAPPGRETITERGTF